MPIIRQTGGTSDDSQHPFDDIESNSSLSRINSERSVKGSSFDVRPDIVSLSEMNNLEPRLGEMVYESDNGVNRYWNGVEWKEVTSEGTINDDVLDNRIIVNQSNFLTTICGVIDSTKNYFLDGLVDIGSNQVTVPSTGLTVTGYSFDLSAIIKTTGSNAIFTSPVGGSGNLLLENLYLVAVNGASVFDLTDATGFNAFEFNKINYIDCESLGSFTQYRQGLEVGTGRFGGKPTLELIGNMVGGFRISTSIVRGLDSDMTTPLFKAGAGLLINGRFITDINADLPAAASLFDFSPSNIANNESLILSGAYTSRLGSLDPTDTSTTPNIDDRSVKCLWTDNTGLPNTYKFAQQTITTEVATTVTSSLTYYPLAGDFTVGDISHFDSPSEGQLRCLSGNDVYRISGNLVLESQQNNQIGLRITKSVDGGSTFPTEINHISRVINNVQGGRDVAYFQIDFLSRLSEGEIIRAEVENYTSTQDITAEIDSYITVSST